MRFRFESRGKFYDVVLERQGDGYHASVNGEAYDLELLDQQPGRLSLLLAGQPLTLDWANDAGGKKWVSLTGCTYLLERPSNRPRRRPGERAEEDTVRAPMPAQVRELLVTEGDAVEKGQPLLLLEAMKMEIRLVAPRPGKVAKLAVVQGQPVEREQVLVEIEGEEQP